AAFAALRRALDAADRLVGRSAGLAAAAVVVVPAIERGRAGARRLTRRPLDLGLRRRGGGACAGPRRTRAARTGAVAGRSRTRRQGRIADRFAARTRPIPLRAIALRAVVTTRRTVALRAGVGARRALAEIGVL